MKKNLFVLFSLFLMQGTAKAQITRGLWEYGPVITTTNNGYGWVVENLKAIGFASAEMEGIEFWNNTQLLIVNQPCFHGRVTRTEC